MKSLDKFIVNILNRYAWPRWPAKTIALNRAKTVIYIGKRKRVFFKCELCGKEKLSQKEVECDHTYPRIDPKKGWQGIEKWIERTFCNANDLKVLCHDCHKSKSAGENEVRRETKKTREFNLKRKRK